VIRTSLVTSIPIILVLYKFFPDIQSTTVHSGMFNVISVP
jgi:hypothetical protein